jgi:acetyl-CoA synthetase
VEIVLSTDRMGMEHGSLKSDNINGSNILQFMKKHQIATYQQLLQKSVENIAWYWNAVNEDLGFEWYDDYTQVFDSSEGKTMSNN